MCLPSRATAAYQSTTEAWQRSNCRHDDGARCLTSLKSSALAAARAAGPPLVAAACRPQSSACWASHSHSTRLRHMCGKLRQHGPTSLLQASVPEPAEPGPIADRFFSHSAPCSALKLLGADKIVLFSIALDGLMSCKWLLGAISAGAMGPHPHTRRGWHPKVGVGLVHAPHDRLLRAQRRRGNPQAARLLGGGVSHRSGINDAGIQQAAQCKLRGICRDVNSITNRHEDYDGNKHNVPPWPKGSQYRSSHRLNVLTICLYTEIRQVDGRHAPWSIVISHLTINADSPKSSHCSIAATVNLMSSQ